MHIDEALLTLYRVKEMLLDPIATRYAVVEPDWKKSAYWFKGKDDDKDKKKDDKKDAKVIVLDTKEERERIATKRRMQKCNFVCELHKLPTLARMWPYLDYMLPNEAIMEAWHIVTSPGNAKSLEEWENIFASATDDDIAMKWKECFGKAERLYVKAKDPHTFYLAVKMTNVNIPRTAYLCQEFEKEKCREYAQKIKDAAKKEEEKIKAVEINNALDAERGYCFHYHAGDCSGGCHGDVKNCDEPAIRVIPPERNNMENGYYYGCWD